MIFMILFVCLIMVISLAFMPYVTRKTELFGVGIPSAETKRPEFQMLRKKYMCQALLFGVLLVIFNIYIFYRIGMESTRGMTLFIIGIFAYLLLTFVIYLPKHYRVLRIKKEQNWSANKDTQVIVDTSLPQKDTISLKWLWMYPLIVALTIAGVILCMPYAPEQIPMHYDAAMNVTRYAPKGIFAVLPLLISQAFLFLVFALVSLIIRRAKRQIDAADPQNSREQGIRFRRITSAALIFGGAAMGVIVGMMQIMMLLAVDSSFLIGVITGLMLLITVGMVALFLFVGQGGSRLKGKSQSGNAALNSDEDRFWKLGQFYYNKNDPAVFVEKRFGIGYTNNWARPLSWMLLIGLFTIIAGICISIPSFL